MLSNMKCDNFSLELIVDDFFRRLKPRNEEFFDITETKNIFNELYKTFNMDIDLSTDDVISLLRSNNFKEFNLSKSQLKNIFKSYFGISDNSKMSFNLFDTKDDIKNIDNNLDIDHIVNKNIEETNRIDLSEKLNGNEINLDKLMPGLLKYIINIKSKSINNDLYERNQIKSNLNLSRSLSNQNINPNNLNIN